MKINENVIQELICQAQKDAPNETCGYLLGTDDMVAQAGDDRALFFGVGRELVVSTPGEFTSGYSVAKFRNAYSNGDTPHNNKFVDIDYFLMRSAEAYLNAAEASVQLGKSSTEIIDILTPLMQKRLNATALATTTTAMSAMDHDQLLQEVLQPT